LMWSPQGDRLAVLHDVGADVLWADGLRVQLHERLNPHVIAWHSRPSEMQTLRPLIERIRDTAERLWQQPFVIRHDPDVKSVAEDARAALRVLPVTASWSRADSRTLSRPKLDARDCHLLLLAPGSHLLPERRHLHRLDFVSALDRALDSPKTVQGIESLCKSIGRSMASNTIRGPGVIDTIAWGDESPGRLYTVGRENKMRHAQTAVYVEGALSSELQAPEVAGCVVVEYAGRGGSSLWTDGRSIWVDDGNGPIRLDQGISRAERYAPDGSMLAVVDAHGRFSLLPIARKVLL
jgi:hypothetical protein